MARRNGACGRVRREQLVRNAGVDLRSRHEIHRHHRGLRQDEEDFLPVTPPSRPPATGVGDLQFLIERWKRCDVDLEPPRLVGDVGEPLAVVGKLRLVLVEWPLDHGEGLAGLALGVKRKHVQVLELALAQFVNEILPVLRPILHELVGRGLEERCLRADAVGVLDEDVGVAFAIGDERNALAVWRPDGVHVIRRIQRQLGGDPALHVDHPDIRPWRAWVLSRDGDHFFIRGRVEISIGSRIARRRQQAAGAIVPAELPARLGA